jgi:hypothetical protein
VRAVDELLVKTRTIALIAAIVITRVSAIKRTKRWRLAVRRLRMPAPTRPPSTF